MTEFAPIYCLFCDKETHSRALFAQHLLQIHRLTSKPLVTAVEAQNLNQFMFPISRIDIKHEVEYVSDPEDNFAPGFRDDSVADAPIDLLESDFDLLGIKQCSVILERIDPSSYSFLKVGPFEEYEEPRRKGAKCLICEQVYVDMVQMINHIIRHHSIKKGMYCPLCGKVADDVQFTWNHLIKCHFKLRIYQCLRCGERFYDIKKFTRHSKKAHPNHLAVPHRLTKRVRTLKDGLVSSIYEWNHPNE